MNCTARCLGCGQFIEFSLSIGEILRQPQQGEGRVEARLAEWEVTARLPTSHDVIHALQSSSPERAQGVLLQLCIVSSRRKGVPVSVGDLPEDVLNEVVRLIEQRDPLAAFTVSLECPDCARQWEAPFDIVGYLWNEIHSWAIALMGEIHTLARAYGWSESTILSLSPVRRRMYLDMVTGS